MPASDNPLIQALSFHKPELIPAILAQTVEEYVVRLEQLEQSKASWVQVDFMDGQFVAQKTILPAELIGRPTKLSLEAHLMVVQPEQYFPDLVTVGVRRVLLHREVYASLEECSAACQQARSFFPEVGIALNPDTEIEDYHSLPIQAIQCMGVHPGASGQPLLEEIYATIEKVKSQRLSSVIAVDGGVNQDTIQTLHKGGVSRFVLSSAIFNTQPLQQNLQKFIQLISPGGV